MADLNEISASQSIKLAGADPNTGIESFYAQVDPSGQVKVEDIVNVSGIYGSIALSTTAIELKVNASRLTSRKVLGIDNNTTVTIYWGYNSSVSSTSFAGRIFKDQFITWSVGDQVPIFVVIATGTATARVSEGS